MKARYIISGIFFLLILSIPSVFAQKAQEHSIKGGIDLDRLSRLTTYLEHEIEAENLHGAVINIFRKGEPVLNETIGYKNLALKEPIPKDGIFFIQSMTKPIVSVALMMLYEEGYFELDDPVSIYLPEFGKAQIASEPEAIEDINQISTIPANRQITIADLLQHTSGLLHGLSNQPLDRLYREKMYAELKPNLEEHIAVIASLPLAGEPGEKWRYSASPDVLARLVEHFSGMNTSEFFQKRIFDPLEMNDTGYNIDPSKNSRVVDLHFKRNDQPIVISPNQTPTEGRTLYTGAFGLFSTPSDYMKFCKMLLNGGSIGNTRLLSRKTVELMTLDHVGDKRDEAGNGFGLGFGVVNDIAEANTLGSEGTFYWNGAYNTYFFIDPVEECIAIMMMQFAPYTDTHRRKFWQLVYQSMVD